MPIFFHGVINANATKTRIDTLGALHHVIAGENARKKVFDDDDDRDFFLMRVGYYHPREPNPMFCMSIDS